MIGAINVIKRRLLNQATVHPVGAAGIEAAAAINLNAKFLFVRQDNIRAPFLGWIGNGDGVNQGLDVRVLGVFNDLYGVTRFGHGPLIKQVNLIANLLGGAQVMGNI